MCGGDKFVQGKTPFCIPTLETRGLASLITFDNDNN